MANFFANLDEMLLVGIMSLLPTEEVLGARLVSNRFRNLHTLLSRFDFLIPADTNGVRTAQCINFIIWALNRHTEPTLFTFRFRSYSQYPESRMSTINTMVTKAVLKHLQNLELDVQNLPQLARLPLTLYTSATLCKLDLSGRFLLTAKDNTNLPVLKTIRLSHVTFRGNEAFQNLINNCPQLKVLTIDHVETEEHKTFNINSHSLTNLTILYQHVYYLHLVVNAPNIRFLTYFCPTVENCIYAFGEMPHLNVAFLCATPVTLHSFHGLRHIVDRVRHLRSLKALPQVLEVSFLHIIFL